MTSLKLPTDFLHVVNKLCLDDMHINQTFDYYHSQYCRSAAASDFVATSERIPEVLRQSNYIGYSDRTMGTKIPPRRSYEGAAIRGALQRCGLIRASGHELFRGCVVFPEFDPEGHICSAIGFRIASRLREWDKPTVKWVKPPPGAFELMGLQTARDMINGKTYQ